MKNFGYLASFVCLLATGCGHHHRAPDKVGYCTITYDYFRNAFNELEPIVTCAVTSALPQSTMSCFMSFQAGGLPYVSDSQSTLTDYTGLGIINLSNGNCFLGETVTLSAECAVDGVILSTLNTGFIPCGI